MRARRARTVGETDDARLLEELAESRLDMLRLETIRPPLVGLGRRLLEDAVARTPDL